MLSATADVRTDSRMETRKAPMTMQRKVLIVEDDANIQQLVQLHLRDMGCSTDVASDGEIGLEKELRVRRNWTKCSGLKSARMII